MHVNAVMLGNLLVLWCKIVIDLVIVVAVTPDREGVRG